MSELLEELLSKPVGPAVSPRQPKEADLTRSLEISANTATAVIRDLAGTVNEGTALTYLAEEGQDPEDWEVTHFRKLKWGNPEDPYESVKFSFKRVRFAPGERLPIDELLADVTDHEPTIVRPAGAHGFLVLLGDMQFGKTDGDGVRGTLQRTIDCLNKAADRLVAYRQLFDIGHVHIAWLGDHVEGFTSQGGANAWRTELTLTEQIRLTRRVMLHALKLFAPMAEKVTMAAVPGNHGETVRFEGKGVTRYDDSHDTESLIAVADAAEFNPEAFGHVEFFVPDTDELTVLVEVAGTRVAHAHGHKWRPGKHFDWWQGQSFNRASNMATADLLVAGHLHHEFIDTDTDRTFIQPPAMESESTWFRHSKGTGGAPGLIIAVTKDGQTNLKEVVRA